MRLLDCKSLVSGTLVDRCVGRLDLRLRDRVLRPFAKIEVLVLWCHAEHGVVDLFEDHAIKLAGWRDGHEASEEGDGA